MWRFILSFFRKPEPEGPTPEWLISLVERMEKDPHDPLLDYELQKKLNEERSTKWH